MFKITMLATFAALAALPAFAQEVDWKKVDEAFGRSGAVAGDVHRYGFPRSDLQVTTLEGVTIKPAFALGGWIAMKPAHGGVMAMGDLVLLSLAVLFRWKVSNPLLIAVTAVIGLIAYPLLQPTWIMVK